MAKNEQDQYRQPEESERYQNDAIFFETHRDEYAREFPDQFIAIYREERIGSAKRVGNLIRQLKKRQLTAGQVFIARATPAEQQEEAVKFLRSLRPR